MREAEGEREREMREAEREGEMRLVKRLRESLP